MDFLIFIITVAVIFYLNQQKQFKQKSKKTVHRSARGGRARPNPIKKPDLPSPLQSARPNSSNSPLRGIEITATQRRLLGKNDPSVIAASLNNVSAEKTVFGIATAGALFASLNNSNDSTDSWFDRLFAGSQIDLDDLLSTTFEKWNQAPSPFDIQEINPATGLPMVGGVDVAGNIYGTDSTQFDYQISSDGSGMDHFSSFDSHSSSNFHDW